MSARRGRPPAILEHLDHTLMRDLRRFLVHRLLEAKVPLHVIAEEIRQSFGTPISPEAIARWDKKGRPMGEISTD